MTLLDVNKLTVKYGPNTVVDDISFSLREGQWLMLIGPNGAGKSTVVNAITQGTSYSGSVCYLGQDVKKFKANTLAKNIGVLAQTHSVGYSFTVGEVVRLGRYAHAPGIFAQRSDEDERSVEEAMELTGILPLANQSVLTLSGGELQRTFLAQLLAQNPKLLILDEPTNHLDLIYQKQIFKLVQQWLQGSGRAVISVVHDLSLARAYGTHALLMDKGKAIALGKTEEVFTSENLNQAYTMDVREWMLEMLGQWKETTRDSCSFTV